MSEIKRDFTIPDDALAQGSHHAGFVVSDILPVPELSATAYVMCHEASGARAMWLACADTNRSFAIAFKTPPADNTGVFHILEHSVLCGSERFPVKEPFVNLLKTSMQTFLNAMTFPDKTVYPVASTNVQDLENLMDVYLDAVLHPAIYQHPHIFEQEGWHLELVDADGAPVQVDDPTARLVYNGVVFNEMKGALSDPDDVLLQAVDRALFPDTAYGFESGGNPRAIPTLSYEAFLDTHARHYNVSNSYTILYGDLDIDRELAFIDERFRRAEQRDVAAPNPLHIQAPLKAPLTQIEMATAPSHAAVALASVIGTAADRERVLATEVLFDALAGSNEAPLKRAVLDAGLGDDFSWDLVDAGLQPFIVLQLRGAHKDVAERFRTLVETTCAEIVSRGIDRDRLEASIAQVEFTLRERDWGITADGVALSIAALNSWLYDDTAPVSYLRFEDELAHMKAGLKTSYFEQLLHTLIPAATHAAAVELVPVGEGAAHEENAELAAKLAEMTTDERAAVLEEVRVLREEQEKPDDPEALAQLPQLHIADIMSAPQEETAVLTHDERLPCLVHELDTHGIDYVTHYFDMGSLAADELPYVSILTDLLGKLDTTTYSAAELDTRIERELGTLSFSVSAFGREDDPGYLASYVVVHASALAENVASLATLPSEVWSTTLFTDTERMRDVLTQRRITLEQHFVTSGHAAALARLSVHFSCAADATDRMGGVTYYLFLKDLLAHWDERVTDLTEHLAELSCRMFTEDSVLVSFAGSSQDRARFWECGGNFGLTPARDERKEKQLSLPYPTGDTHPVYEAFVIPSDVCYVAEGSEPRSEEEACMGVWQVASRALSYDYLWNEVRVKGGAYGVGFYHGATHLSQFWSYRDPGVDATLARFESAGAWLETWDGSDEELEGYVVSTVAGLDMPLKPRHVVRRQDSEYLSGYPAGWRMRMRAHEIETTAEDMRMLASSLKELAQTRSVVVFGARDVIERSALPFTVVHLMDEVSFAEASTSL